MGSTHDPRAGFVPEVECGIKLTQPETSGEVLLVLFRFLDNNVPLDYLTVPLDAFMCHGFQVAYMKDDPVSRELYEKDQWARDFLFQKRQPWEEWYLKQPVVIRFTDGRRHWDYRMTFYNWLTGEQELTKILNRDTPVAPFEEVTANTAEEPHVIIDPV